MSEAVIRNPVIRQGWLRVLLFAVAFCILTLLVALPAAVLLAGVTFDQLKSNLLDTLEGLLESNYIWLMILVEFAIAVLSVGIFRLWIDRKGLKGLGWSPDGFTGEAVIGLFMGPAVMGFAALLMWWSGHLSWVDISWDPSSLFVSFGLMALIAFSEELIFRGYILGNLMDSFANNSFGNKWVALILSSVLFAGFHFTGPGIHTLAFVNLFLAGCLLGINYLYTRNLWFSFFFHLSWNFFQGPILGFRVSGLTFPSLLVTETKGDLFITGGDFGLEGSILTTVTAFIAFFLVAWAFERKYNSGNLSLTA